MSNEITVSEGTWTTARIEKTGNKTTMSMLSDDYIDELMKDGFVRGKPVRKNGRTVTVWKKIGGVK